MQLSRVLGYQANKSGINAWLDGIRGNFCVLVVRLQQVKGKVLKHHLTRSSEKIDGISEGCKKSRMQENHGLGVYLWFAWLLSLL